MEYHISPKNSRGIRKNKSANKPGAQLFAKKKKRPRIPIKRESIQPYKNPAQQWPSVQHTRTIIYVNPSLSSSFLFRHSEARGKKKTFSRVGTIYRFSDAFQWRRCRGFSSLSFASLFSRLLALLKCLWRAREDFEIYNCPAVCTFPGLFFFPRF